MCKRVSGLLYESFLVLSNVLRRIAQNNLDMDLNKGHKKSTQFLIGCFLFLT